MNIAIHPLPWLAAASLLLLGAAPATPGPLPTVDPVKVAAASATLRRATSDAPIHAACQTLDFAFFISAVRTPELDAAVVALRDLAHAHKIETERVWCLRNIRNAVTQFCRVPEPACAAEARPYKPAFTAMIDELLTDDDPAIRIVAAKSTWGWFEPKAAPIMLGRALDDPSPAVRAAMLSNLPWPLIAARQAGMPDAAFMAAIDRGLRDPDPRIFSAALQLDVFVRVDTSAATLRAFARSPDPMHRVAAMAASSGVPDLVENGLVDPDVRVRFAAMDALFLPTKRARARLTTMMRSAPTRAERDEAKAQLAAFGTRTFR